MWIMTTRNRPDACRDLIDAMTALGEVPEVAVMIDHSEADGLHLYDEVRWPPHWHIHASNDHLEMAAALNRLVEMYPGRPFYGLCSDNSRPRTKGWADELAAEAGDWNIAYSADGWLDGCREDRPWLPRICGAIVLGGELVRTLGWAMLPGLVHLYADDVIEAIGERLGLLRYRPDVLVEADRPQTTGKAPDANHKRIHKGISYAEADRQRFEAWREHERAIDVARVFAAAGIAPLDQPVTFACVKVGDRYDARWVNILLDMVQRNAPPDARFGFACVTDDPAGLDPRIDVKSADSDLHGWWAKLQLFRKGTFPEGQRVIYLDLDSLVLDEIDRLLAYRGPLALLRDFYFPDRLGSGVMMWRAGRDVAEIWTDWDLSDRPEPADGDQAWIWGRRPNALRLQDIYPGAFVSYKVDCRGAIPDGARVVSFHGTPKNDDAPDAWVGEVWKIGGINLTKARVALNVAEEEIAANIRASAARNLPMCRKVPAHDKRAVLVGGGASLINMLPLVRHLQSGGAHVFALNGAALFLKEHGITADYQVILDARPENARFLKGSPAGIALIASQCSPAIFDAALIEGAHPHLYHVAIPAAEALMKGKADFCWCATTVGLTALGLAHMLGYRDMHLFGYDSSYRDGKLHAYEQTLTEPESRRIEAWCEGRWFVTSPAMLKQAEEFQSASVLLAESGCDIAVHSDGLLPHIARTIAARQAAADNPMETAA